MDQHLWFGEVRVWILSYCRELEGVQRSTVEFLVQTWFCRVANATVK
jgi:hypothetical protein